MSIIQKLKEKFAHKKRNEKLRFLFADGFLNMLLVYRSLWIQGRYGGGKTSLAVILAAWLLNSEHVKRVVTNFSCVLDSPIQNEPIPTELLYDAALIIDETHAYIADRASVNSYAKYLRKTNYFMLMPSVMPPHIRLTAFAVQRIINGYVFGLPVWVYKWTLRSANIKETGIFAILHPTAVFGAYDTKDIPMTDGGISDAIELTIAFEQWQSAMTKRLNGTRTKEDLYPEFMQRVARGEDPLLDFAKSKPSKSKKEAIEKGSWTNEKAVSQNQDLIDTLEDSAEELAKSTAELADAARKIRRGKKR